MEIEHLIFSEGPQRVAPFSHAVRAGEYLFITGQMPTLKHDNTKLVKGGIEEQTLQVMNNLIDVLNRAGSLLEKVIFARVYLVNFQDFDRMNEVYSSFQVRQAARQNMYWGYWTCGWFISRNRLCCSGLEIIFVKTLAD